MGSAVVKVEKAIRTSRQGLGRGTQRRSIKWTAIAMLIPIDDTSSRMSLPDAVYLILKNHQDHLEPVGTGFAISPSLIITAAHVFEEASLTGRGIVAIRFHESGPISVPILLAHWRFQGMYKTQIDLGLGIVAPTDPNVLVLDLQLPNVGEPVVTVGFPDTEHSYLDGSTALFERFHHRTLPRKT
jgi:hypothetical protein